MAKRHPASALGRWSAAHPRLVVAVWSVLCALALWQATGLGDVLRGELGSVPGAPSDLAQRAIREDFDYPFARPLIVTLEALQEDGARPAPAAGPGASPAIGASPATGAAPVADTSPVTAPVADTSPVT
ncbi:MAG: hypothetical protein FJZ01_26185, partial [Candidatus Sericytochromatia bacterium]|nr:hypothetical protein [Candidatus Tanganyikabacteria bacterium]